MSGKSTRAASLVLAIAATGLLGGIALTSAAHGPCNVTGSTAGELRNVDGALGEDQVEDSSAIQRAIDQASRDGGAIVKLPAGTLYLDEPLVVKSNVALRGAGPDTVLKASSRFLETKGPYGGHPLITTDGASNVTIERLTADHSGDELDGNVSGRLNEYLVDVRHSKNAVVEQVTTRNPFTYSIAVVGSQDFCVFNNQTTAVSSGKYNQLDGIHITDSHSGLVAGNTVDQRRGEDGDDGLVTQTIGSPVYNVEFRDNDVRGGSHGSGMQLALGNHEIRDIQISGNHFWGSQNGIQTGYYGGSAPVSDILISQNRFTDIPGPAVIFTGELRNITVTDNAQCRSGGVEVEQGESNRISVPSEDC